MKKRILSLALAVILTLALVPAAFAAGNTETADGGVTISNVVSTKGEAPRDWHEDGEYVYAGITYYCDSAPVTITLRNPKDLEESRVIGINWKFDAETTSAVIDKLEETDEYEYALYGTLILNAPGVYLFSYSYGDFWKFPDGHVGMGAGDVNGFYVVVGGGSSTPAPAPSGNPATPTASTVYVNDISTAFEAYTIDGNNYFKLRDLAAVLNGTDKQFEVGYDNSTKAITLTSGKAYTTVGGEMAAGDGTAKTANPTASKIYLDGKELSMTVYTINGNNFFKLRDLMNAVDVYVGYDDATKAITLDTSKGYVD